MSLAKGLGGGFPVGAMLTREAYSGALPPGTHGSTFGGNPLGAAALLSVLSILEEEDLVAGARRIVKSLSTNKVSWFPAKAGVQGTGARLGG